EADVVHARPAVLLGDADAEQLQVGHPLEELALESVLAVEVVDLLRHLGARPLTHGALDFPVLVGEVEGDHDVTSISGPSRRACGWPIHHFTPPPPPPRSAVCL